MSYDIIPPFKEVGDFCPIIQLVITLVSCQFAQETGVIID